MSPTLKNLGRAVALSLTVGQAFLTTAAHGDISTNITTSGAVSVVVGSNTITALTLSNAPLPVAVGVGSYSGQTNSYMLLATNPSGLYVDENPIGASPFVIGYWNKSGSVVALNQGTLVLSNAGGAFLGEVGNGAIVALGLPNESSTTELVYRIGSDVTVTNTGDITVVGSGNFLASTPLYPPSFRMAALSGIAAASYGFQGTNESTSHTGGSVTVNSSNAAIVVSNPNKEIVTAGISAASATGPGSTYGTNNASHVTVSLLGLSTITNSAASGVGVMATATGAGFIAGGSSSVAFGSDVEVNLGPGSTIYVNGNTGVGVFAASQVYVPADPKKDSSVQSGSVTVVSSGDLISTGNTNATLSVGILAVSAGTDLLLNPFASQTVNGFGVGDASAVIVTNSADVESTGTMSVGIAGMSLGGAGVATSNNGDEESYLGNANGETDGAGAAVTITNSGSVTTLGASAYGIVALSSGGGGLINNVLPSGGNTNSTNGLVVGNNTSNSGGSASAGGTILVQQNGSVTTGDGNGGGNASIGVIAQSIGGAGGNAGGKHPALFVGDKGGQGGAGGEVDVNTSTDSQVTTKDTNSVGILAQSIGGGGGNGGNSVGLFVSVGGQGGSGGAGGLVSVASGGSVTTRSDHSTGIIAHSIGGGGGHGGGSHAAGFLVDLGIGGKGATGGAGGTVFLDQDGAITTSGNNSSGVILQSLGGGGGTGGNALSYSASALIDINLALGGSGSGGGAGGQVNVLLDTGSIITTGVPGAINGFMNQNGADSHGLLAQSIGGGGGQAGSAVGKGVAVSGESEGVSFAGVVSFVIGGSGGSASAGGTITAQNQGGIQTYSDGSHGAVVQSIGGGGGHGGDSTSVNAIFASDSTTASLNLSLGGQGGGGGRGGDVSFINVTNSGATSSITTHAQSSHGILAQSVGGGGGSGGVGNAEAKASSGQDSGNTNIILTIAIGGQSGGGGNAGPTVVTNHGSISTAGSDSHGILAQAVGGGGGAAGGGNASGGNNSYTANVTIGRTGGDGGSTTTNAAGYSVTVANSGSITTLGGDGNGITAQSIGGGGGKGGTADANASLETGSIPSEIFSSRGYSSDVSVGGTGGSGGGGGAVLVENTGNISTAGGRAHGVLAQSVSGGGGLGGSATSGANPGFFSLMDPTGFFSIDVAVGGRGGDSSSGGAVTVSNLSVVGTAGYGANGILAQSIAGGGGVGADGTADANTTLGLGIGVNRTASGTDAANGGAVTVLQGGQVTTADADALGVLAQSVAGGGGVASAGGKPLLSPAISVGVLPLRADVSLGINLSGSDAMNGGAVTITQNVASMTTTLGDWSHGLVAQSIGAGGGKASTIFGTSGPAIADLDVQVGATNGQGNAGPVTLQVGGTISTGTNTSGYAAYGVLGQSIGGGGGMATDASMAATGTIRLGSMPDAKGAAGNIGFTGSATIGTVGESAHGVLLQSIGAGGGLAGSGNSETMSGVTNSAPSIQLGGTSKGGGVGGTISVASTNAIETSGGNAFGVVLQSIGGGGGLVTTRQTSGTVTLGASGGDSKDTQYFAGGSINATFASNASVTTTGAGSHGVVAQSIGGGGGIANPSSVGGLTTNAPVLNPGAALGYGGNISITNAADINVIGNGAVGILAQSIGGGGGLTGAFAGVTGGAGSSGTSSGGGNGNVVIDVQGSSQITAEGTNSVGIFAQNVTAGTHGLGRIDLSVSGKVYGGSGSNGRGVWVDGGSSNSLLVNSGGTVVGTGTEQAAVYYSGGNNLKVTNLGVVSGTVWLSAGTTDQGAFTNTSGGSFLTQGTNNAIMQDAGTTTIGTDYRYAANAIFLGAYQQTGTGELYMDIFGVGDQDVILFGGVGHGSFAGDIYFSFTNYNANVGDTFTMIGPAAAGFTNSFGFQNVNLSGLASGVLVEQLVEDDSFKLLVTAVPEPSTWALVVLGGAMIVLRLLARRSQVIRK
jgi:hypothetical protein